MLKACWTSTNLGNVPTVEKNSPGISWSRVSSISSLPPSIFDSPRCPRCVYCTQVRRPSHSSGLDDSFFFLFFSRYSKPGLFCTAAGYDGHRRYARSMLHHDMPPVLLPLPVQVKAMELYGMFIYLLCYEICWFIICSCMRSYSATHARVSFLPLSSRHSPSPFALCCDATIIALTQLVTSGCDAWAGIWDMPTKVQGGECTVGGL